MQYLIIPLKGRAGSTALCLVLVPPEETVEGLLLASHELAALDTRVIDTEEGVDVVHGLCPDVGKLLDLGGDILDLVVAQREAELLYARFDGVPTGQTVT